MSKSSAFGLSTKRHRVEIALRPHRVWWVQALLILWRWSFEITAVITGIWVYQHLAHDLPGWAAACVMFAPLGVALAVPWSRRIVVGFAWCTVTRHRLRSFFTAVRLTNGHGKLPWLLLVRPTPVGERALCLMVAGLSANDLADRGEAIASTCWASDARVSRSKRLAALVWIDVIRRDPLSATKPLGSELMPTARRFGRLHAVPSTDPVPARPVALVENFTPSAAPVVDLKPVARQPAKTRESNDGASGPTVVRNGEDLSDYV
jgi:hypothetical protein